MTRSDRGDVPARGAYGFRILDLESAGQHLHEVPENWPTLQIAFASSPSVGTVEAPGTIRIIDNRAELWLAEAGRITVLREPLTVRFETGVPLTPDAILHPFLGLPSAIAAWWLGRVSLHGGAFMHGGYAWGLLGDREAGKSATLAHLLQAGHTVLSDDILIVEGANLFAGPRSVDLRAASAPKLGGEDLGVIGNRARWRLRPPSGPAQAPLGGFVSLKWADTMEMLPLPAEARLQLLITSSALRPTEEQSLSLLELASLPAWELSRPCDLDQIPHVVDRLIAGLAVQN